MTKSKQFKTITKNKYTTDDLQAIDTFQPQGKKFGRQVISVSVSKEIKTWLEEAVRYCNVKSKRKITKSDIAFLALTQLKEKTSEQILGEFRNL
jgi:hypothetical protein